MDIENEYVSMRTRLPQRLVHMFFEPVILKIHSLECEMLIDQNKKIKGNLIGHRCGNPADWKLPIGNSVMTLYICNSCKAKFANSDEFLKINFPQWVYDFLGV